MGCGLAGGVRGVSASAGALGELVCGGIVGATSLTGGIWRSSTLFLAATLRIWHLW